MLGTGEGEREAVGDVLAEEGADDSAAVGSVASLAYCGAAAAVGAGGESDALGDSSGCSSDEAAAD